MGIGLALVSWCVKGTAIATALAILAGTLTALLIPRGRPIDGPPTSSGLAPTPSPAAAGSSGSSSSRLTSTNRSSIATPDSAALGKLLCPTATPFSCSTSTTMAPSSIPPPISPTAPTTTSTPTAPTPSAAFASSSSPATKSSAAPDPSANTPPQRRAIALTLISCSTPPLTHARISPITTPSRKPLNLSASPRTSNLSIASTSATASPGSTSPPSHSRWFLCSAWRSSSRAASGAFGHGRHHTQPRSPRRQRFCKPAS